MKFRGIMEPQIELQTQSHNSRSMSIRTNCYCPACQNISRRSNPIDLCLCSSVCTHRMCVCVRAKFLGSTLIFQFSTVSPFCPQSSLNSPFSIYSLSFNLAPLSILSVYILHRIQTNRVTPYAYVTTSFILLLPV